MSELLHRIKVFLFRFEDSSPEYLLFKPDQGHEALWGPLQSALGFGEKLEAAIRRHVIEDVGIAPPGEVIDLDLPARWSLGDEQIVEWNFGFRCLAAPDPTLLQRNWAEHRWADLSLAYPSLGLEYDRQAILRLHARIDAA